MKIKICGITTLDDALMCADLGIDYLGFNFYPKSSRYISPAKAAGIIEKLPPGCVPVGVFVNSHIDAIKTIQQQTTIQCIQLHGNESFNVCQSISLPLIKAISVKSIRDLDNLAQFASISTLLIDSFDNAYGGTGSLADWKLASIAAKRYPIMLAGGLNADNIAIAISRVAPASIDICTGTEASPRSKSKIKIERLLKTVRGVLTS